MENNNSNNGKLGLWLTFLGAIIAALFANWDKVFTKPALPNQKLESPSTSYTTTNSGDENKTYNGSQITENNYHNTTVVQPTKKSEVKTFALQNIELLPHIAQIEKATKYQFSKQSTLKISISFEPNLKQLENDLFTYDGGYLSIEYSNQRMAITELKLNAESQHGNNQDFVRNKVNQQIQNILKDTQNHHLIVNKIISCLK